MANKKLIVSVGAPVNGGGGGGAVDSVFGRTGNVIAQNGDYNTSQVTEGSNLYYTEDRVSNNSSVQANTAKNSYPSSDATKLSNIEDNAEVNTINTDTTGEPTGSDLVLNVVSLTQAEYDAGTPVATTFYLITDA
jgi:hypothetical protein